MNKITNEHIIKVKELISDEVCLGTYGLVELELLEMEKELEILRSFKNKISEQKDLDPKFAELVNENFWDLV